MPELVIVLILLKMKMYTVLYKICFLRIMSRILILIEKVLNSQSQQLTDLCIASQLRVLNGRFVADSLGNMTCFKPSGSSTIDYALASVDLINSFGV